MASPRLAVEALSCLPVTARFMAYADFDRALIHHGLARQGLRTGAWDWRLDMHRARRFWSHYAATVRAAQNMRNAA